MIKNGGKTRKPNRKLIPFTLGLAYLIALRTQMT